MEIFDWNSMKFFTIWKLEGTSVEVLDGNLMEF